MRIQTDDFGNKMSKSQLLELAHTPSPPCSVTVHMISAGYPAGLVIYEDEDYSDIKEARQVNSAG